MDTACITYFAELYLNRVAHPPKEIAVTTLKLDPKTVELHYIKKIILRIHRPNEFSQDFSKSKPTIYLQDIYDLLNKISPKEISTLETTQPNDNIIIIHANMKTRFASLR